MSKLIDETGNTYGYWTVLEKADSINGRAAWKCKCKCGTIKIIKGTQLRNGSSKSCGCFQKEQTSKACSKNLIGQTIGNFTILESIQGEKYGERHKWRCRCNLCGNEQVYIATSNLTKQESCGCLFASKGERKIKEILTENNIDFIEQKRFSDLIFPETKHQARYDFYLPKYNTLIEYDGIQHYIQGSGVYDNEEKFNLTKKRDQIKTEYAKNNNIPLIRIPYTHLEKLCLNDLLPNISTFIVR